MRTNFVRLRSRIRATLSVGATIGAIAAVASCRVQTPLAEIAPATTDDSVNVAWGPASLDVVNQSIFDVRVFVIHAGQFTRLGTVTSMTTASYTLEPNVVSREFNLYADPVGSTMRQKTDLLFVRPGQQVTFQLEKKMRSYQIAVH